MNRNLKKVIAVLCAIAMVVSTITVYNTQQANAAEYQWTAISGLKSQADMSTLDISYCVVKGTTTQNMISYGDFYARVYASFITANTTLYFTEGMDSTTTETYGNMKDPTGGYFNFGLGLNGSSKIENNKYYTLRFVEGDNDLVIYLKVGTPTESETTTTTTTTTAAPDAPTGIAANINDLHTNYTISFSNITNATSYNVYVDGVNKGAVTNGGTKTLTELGMTYGTTYAVTVTAVNDAGESAQSAAISVTPIELTTTTVAPTTEAPTTEAPTEAPTTTPVISSSIKVEGYQISTSYEGTRVVGAVESTINGKTVTGWGFVYGLNSIDGTDTGITDDDMIVGSTNDYVKSYASTSAGTIDNKMGNSDTATYYVRTMKFGGTTAKAFNAQYKVRAYAILSDGSYVYSDVSSYSVYYIAEYLYANRLMNSYTSHEYLYNHIISKVDSSYTTVDYNWNNSVVKPGEITE